MNQAYAEGNTQLGDQLAIHAQLKQAEADELAIEEQKTLQLEQQKQAIEEQRAAAERQARAMGRIRSRLTRSRNIICDWAQPLMFMCRRLP